jgi:hypothetical protein
MYHQNRRMLMAEYRDERVPLNKLKLDPTNPRHPQFDSQREIIEWMTSGSGRVGEKLHVLAKDIAEYGLNPADRVMVVADEDEKGQFIVLEGNRRLTALKLLNNPDVAPTKQWQKRFSKLRPSDYSPIKRIPCTVFDDSEKAYHFIELRHLGESKGAGIVPWEAEQKARHDQRVNRRSRHHKALAVLDFIRAADGIDSETKAYADGFPLTTLDRILADKEFRDFLGLDLNADGEICFRIEPREAMKPMSKVFKDFGSGEKSVRHVINKEQRQHYRDGFKGKSVPDHSRVLAAPVRVIDADDLITAKAPAGGPRGRRYPDPRDRRHVVIPGTSLPIDRRRFNRARRVFEELRRIEIRDTHGQPRFPNAGILLVRLFIEMSVDLYIGQHQLKHPSPEGWRSISLTERTKAVLHDLASKGKLAPGVRKAINKSLSDPNKVSNPNSLNDLAHNPDQIPTPHDLCDVWDIYTKFLLALWENIG